jgi:putative radical SAM enzyme (TIGR03279 family)
MSNLIISEVYKGSIAEEAGIEAGDSLISINGSNIVDVFDYRFMISEEALLLEIQKKDGSILRVDIEKDESEEIGLCFENPLLDEEKSCRNKCVFCFIDQLPSGMRQTLYYKDDDARLSFLFGNYVTMTNMGKDDIDRIIKYHMSPVNVSVHTTNPELRVKMLNNRFAGDILAKMKAFSDSGIILNAQIVLCKGINDGEELERTLTDLSTLMPMLNSISIVPVGLTRYRDGLPVLAPIDSVSAMEVILQVEKWQQYFLEKTGSRRVYLSDEWYLMSGTPLPDYNHYEDFPQIENGVGMTAMFVDEFKQALSSEETRPVNRVVSVATGALAAGFISNLAQLAESHFPGLKIIIHNIENLFFGNTVTVTGLLTGNDIKNQLLGKHIGEVLLLPSNMFRAGTDIFLDDMELRELEAALQVQVLKVETDGSEFLKALLAAGN